MSAEIFSGTGECKLFFTLSLRRYARLARYAFYARYASGPPTVGERQGRNEALQLSELRAFNLTLTVQQLCRRLRVVEPRRAQPSCQLGRKHNQIAKEHVAPKTVGTPHRLYQKYTICQDVYYILWFAASDLLPVVGGPVDSF